MKVEWTFLSQNLSANFDFADETQLDRLAKLLATHGLNYVHDQQTEIRRAKQFVDSRFYTEKKLARS